MVFLVLAVAVHALLFLGVSFGISLKSVPRLADTLDVVLVQWRSEKEPEEGGLPGSGHRRPVVVRHRKIPALGTCQR